MADLRYGVAQVLLWCLVAVLAVQFAGFVLESVTRETGGFGAYYAAAHVVASGGEASQLYDDDWFQGRIDRIGLDLRDIYRPNPPTVATLMRPLSALDHDQARVGWTVAGLVVLFASLLVIARVSGLRGLWVPAVLALALTYQPLLADVAHAQAYRVLLGLLTMAWFGYRERWFRLTGGVLGLIFAFKTVGGLILALLVIDRQWRALAWAAGVIVAVSLTSLVWVDPGTWRAYLEQLLWMEDRAKLTVTAYQSQAGLIGHLFLFDPEWNRSPVVDAPLLALLLTVATTVGVVLASALAAVRSDDLDLTFATAVLVTVFLSPLSLDYHYTLLLLPIVVLLSWARWQPSPWLWIGLVLGIVLIAASLPYRSPRLDDGLWALFAYPKLYGAWLLWGICLWACVSSSRITAAEVDGRMERYGING